MKVGTPLLSGLHPPPLLSGHVFLPISQPFADRISLLAAVVPECVVAINIADQESPGTTC